jgi:hypothetical protein
MDAPARLRFRHALHAMHAGFEFQLGKHALAGDRRDDFLVAAGLALAGREHLDLPAAGRRVALVHAKQIAGEKRRLRAAGAGADFEDRALFVGGILRQQQDLDVLLQRLDPLLDLGQLQLGKLAHLAVDRPLSASSASRSASSAIAFS